MLAALFIIAGGGLVVKICAVLIGTDIAIDHYEEKVDQYGRRVEARTREACAEETVNELKDVTEEHIRKTQVMIDRISRELEEVHGQELAELEATTAVAAQKATILALAKAGRLRPAPE